MAALGTRPHPVARVTFDLCRLWAAMWGLGKMLPLSHIALSPGKAGRNWELQHQELPWRSVMMLKGSRSFLHVSPLSLCPPSSWQRTLSMGTKAGETMEG